MYTCHDSACPKSCIMDVMGVLDTCHITLLYDVSVTYQHTLAGHRRGRLLTAPISHIFWTHCVMVDNGMVFGEVVSVTFDPWAPKDVKLLSGLSVLEPMVSHIPLF